MVSGIFMRQSAFDSVLIWTESNAFDMSCDNAQISLWYTRASSRICVNCATGWMVDWCGKAA